MKKKILLFFFIFFLLGSALAQAATLGYIPVTDANGNRGFWDGKTFIPESQLKKVTNDKGEKGYYSDATGFIPAPQGTTSSLPSSIVGGAKVLDPVGASVFFKELRKAAAQGHADAQFGLGAMYYKGEGVLQDYSQALFWFRKAAAQGYAHAQYDLGVMYALGRGVLQDMVKAYMWFNLSAANGYELAKKGRKLVEDGMTTKQVNEAQALSRKWQAKHMTPAIPDSQ